jgi:hypothetical protein
LLNRFRLTPRGIKIAVVLTFSLCWLSIVLVRSHAPRDPAVLEGSSLMGLVASFQQGAISGRDFQSTYGPVMQFVASLATEVTATNSPLDAYGMIVFFLCASTAILVAIVLLLSGQISWQQSAVFYGLAIFLNLFFDVLDVRIALLLLNAVFAYRTIAAETMRRQTAWATATGLLCFVSQLVSLELGICAAITVVCALAAGSILIRHAVVLLGIEVFVATLAAANLGLVILFRLTSSSYGLLFDYHNYSLEILRGYHNTMGVPWALPLPHTLGLVIVGLYVLAACLAAIRRVKPLEASFIAALGFAALIWLKTASIRSDVAHIVGAFTPMIFLLSLLVRVEWRSVRRRVAWGLAVAGLLLVWPSLNLSGWMDLGKIIRAEVPAHVALRELYAEPNPLKASLRSSLMTPDLADRRDVPVLPFPYDNYVAAGLGRPFFAPVLESYAASTASLERYYIQALDRRRRVGIDVIYGQDTTLVPPVAGVQAITRTPVIFEYLYTHFDLLRDDGRAGSQHILLPRSEPREFTVEPLLFSIPQRVVDSGIVRLNAPSSCGLIRVQMRIDYMKNPYIFRPGGVDLSLADGERVIWTGSIRPLETNQSFVTYISPLPAGIFHRVFGRSSVPAATWDRLEYRFSPVGMSGAPARRIEIENLQCIDSQRFLEAVPAA